VRVVAAVIGVACLHVGSNAFGQGAVRDQSGTLTATPANQTKTTWLEQHFAGSIAEVTTYIGSGTLYTSGYHDAYVSDAFYVRPSYQLGTKYKLSLNARVYVEEEWTTPDNSVGRRFNPLDSWIYLTSKDLYTMPRAKIRFTGSLRAVIPVSYESRYANLVTALGASGAAARTFEFGRPDTQGKRWELSTSLGLGYTKGIYSSDLRGKFPGDTSGCRQTDPVAFTSGPGGPSPTETDRCGGPLNTSFTVTSSGNIALSRGRYSLSMTLIVINQFKYAIDQTTANAVVAGEMMTQLTVDNMDTVPRGREDFTWGIISAGYDISDHLSVSLGVASYQPALDSTYQHLRFPFFDFTSGPNANNYAQLLVGVTGTL
jgi:hypothetical protein